MKKAIIYIFSGTGNTYKAGELIAADAVKFGVDTTICRIVKTQQGNYESVPDPNDFDVIGFGYPIHAFNTPKMFLDFVKQLPDSKEKYKPAFIFKTSGEPFGANSSSSFSLCKALRHKGYEPKLDFHMLMPYNIMFRYPDEMAKQMYVHTEEMSGLIGKWVKEIAEDHMINGRKVSIHGLQPLRFNVFATHWSYLLRIQWFGAWLSGLIYKVDQDKCTGCGICEKVCPAGHITLVDGKPKFGHQCTMCMGCAMACPNDAIKPGILTPWKVNGNWNFCKLLADEELSDDYTDREDAGYFKLFRKYYRRTEEIYESEKAEEPDDMAPHTV